MYPVGVGIENALKSIKETLRNCGGRFVGGHLFRIERVGGELEVEVNEESKVVEITLYDDDCESEIELCVSIGLYIQNEKFNDFEEYGSIYLEMFSDAKKIIPNLKSLIDNFKKYCGSSSKQAIEYNFSELCQLDKKISGNNYFQ